MTQQEDKKSEKVSAANSPRDSSTVGSISGENVSLHLETRAENLEVPLREVANLESEWHALELRRKRLAPLMDDFGETLY